ncbi:unnamed protein product, partial [Iphiclides podalirius]
MMCLRFEVLGNHLCMYAFEGESVVGKGRQIDSATSVGAEQASAAGSPSWQAGAGMPPGQPARPYSPRVVYFCGTRHLPVLLLIPY